MTELERGTGRRGVVVEFDAAVGLGVVEGTDDRRYPFHCIEIADGTREVELGSDVSFDVLAKFGRWEAANVRS